MVSCDKILRMKTKFYTFTANKAKVVIYPIAKIRTVELRVLVKAGSWYEKGPQWGAFHLLEHLMLEGSRNFPNTQALEAFQKEHGITISAWAGGGDIGFWFRFPNVSLDHGLRLFEELVFHPILPEDAFKREIAVIKQEYLEQWDDPDWRFYRELNKQSFGQDYLYIRDGLGQPEFIKTLTKDDLVNLHGQHSQPQNIVITVVGNVDVYGVKARIRKLLSHKINSQLITNKPMAIQSSKQRYLWHKEDVDRAFVSMSWLTTGTNNTSLIDRTKLKLAAFILGSDDFFTSLLFTRLRQELGLVYTTGARWSEWPAIGQLEVWASTHPSKVDEVIQNMQDIMLSFIKDEMPNKDFLRNRDFVDWQILMDYDAVADACDVLSSMLFWEGKVTSPEEFIEMGKSITEDQVRDVVGRFISKDKTFIGVMSKEDVYKIKDHTKQYSR